MSILGIGLDVTEIERVRALLERHGARFARRILAPGEVLPGGLDPASPRAAAHMAARFAAKEAGVKALGTGFSQGIAPCCLEVRSLPSGKPELTLHGAAAEAAANMGAVAVHLSLTHTRDNAAAVVIIEGRP